jgi:hypothetical protein
MGLLPAYFLVRSTNPKETKKFLIPLKIFLSWLIVGPTALGVSEPIAEGESLASLDRQERTGTSLSGRVSSAAGEAVDA